MSVFFILSKILSIFLNPLWHIAVLMAAAFIAQIRQRTRIAKWLTFFSLSIFFVYSFVPVGQILLRPLETYADAPQTSQLATADGIIILGGFTGSGAVSADYDAAQLNASAERFITAISLHKQFPEKPIWFSGFSGRLALKGWSEDVITRRLLADLRLTPASFFFEQKSRNTAQNAAFSFARIKPKPHEKWILVTSASHMMRAELAFQKAGWPPLILFPVDYKTTKNGLDYKLDPSTGFLNISHSLHEYVGLIIYKITGRI